MSLPNTSASYSLAGNTGVSTFIIDSSNRIQLIADQSGNSPVLVLGCNAVASNTVTSPTQTVTGNQVFTAILRLSTYHPAAQVDIIAKTSGNNGFTFSLKTDGTVRLTIGDGAALTSYDSTAVMSADAFTKHTITATYVDGGSGSVIFAVDGVQLGTTVSTTKTLTDAAVSATISAAKILGAIYGVTIGSVYNFDPTQGTKLAATVTSGAAVWTINTSGDLGARISGERDLVQMTQSKQLIYLPFSGEKYAYNPGTAGYTLTTPTQTFTGNKTFAFDLQLADYTPGSNVTLFDKLSGNDGIRVLLLTTGVIRLVIGDGASATSVDSTAANTLVDGARGTLGVVWTDGVGASFTQNGAALGTNVAAVKTLTSAAATMAVGPWSGYVFSVIITGGVGVVTVNPNASYSSGATWTASTGEVWTIVSGTTVVTAPGAYSKGGVTWMKSAPFSFVQPETIYIVLNQVLWLADAYICDGNSLDTLDLYQKSSDGSPFLRMYAGNDGPNSSQLVLKTTGIAAALFSGSSSTLRVNLNTASTGNAGTNNANGFTLVSNGNTGGNIPTVTVSEIILRSGADSSATQLQIAAFEKAKFGF